MHGATWRNKVTDSTYCAFGCTVGPTTSAFCAAAFASLESPVPALHRNPPNSITNFIFKIVQKITSYGFIFLTF